MQTFTAPVSGDYKLEVWGAQGGCYPNYNSGGLGGYTKGISYIFGNTIISVCVGGEGNQNGYNGGGDRGSSIGGGGATHIAQNNRGTLQGYINNKDEVYIVAGGGGGCDVHGYGGFGGGENGGDGVPGEEQNSTYGRGGTQSSGGVGGNSGTFGLGGNSILFHGYDNGGSGGGGWYGGGGSAGPASPGGGGSGHINTTLITNGATIAGDQTFPKPGGGTETGHSGNGYAIITWQQLPQ